MAGKRTTTKGRCSICGNVYGKNQMTRHLESCRQAAPTGNTTSKRTARRTAFHLVVEGRYVRQYWMHLEVSALADLGLLDAFLRDTWLECCGHMSAFEIEGITYSVAPAAMGDEPMTARLGEVLSPGLTFYHEYDFGDTTHLQLRVVSEHESDLPESEIRLLARNEAPVLPCSVCGNTATEICTECLYSGGGLLCDGCAKEHECDEEMFLPLVNSPRTGVCGYTGTDEPGQFDVGA